MFMIGVIPVGLCCSVSIQYLLVFAMLYVHDWCHTCIPVGLCCSVSIQYLLVFAMLCIQNMKNSNLYSNAQFTMSE
jgi:putative effector of murein hydrolase LrgA (UPF0299 family)